MILLGLGSNLSSSYGDRFHNINLAILNLKKSYFSLVTEADIHPFFKKVITSSKKYHVHDEKNKFKVGDIVKIIESRPFSRMKRWEVINK